MFFIARDLEDENYRIICYRVLSADDGVVTRFGISAGTLVFVAAGFAALYANPDPANGSGEAFVAAFASLPLILLFPVALIGFFVSAAKYFSCDEISAERKTRTKKLIFLAMVVPLLVLLLFRLLGTCGF